MKLVQIGTALALLGAVLGTCPHLEEGLQDWSLGTTWNSGTVPEEDEQVVIPSGKHVLLTSSPPCLATLVIESEASLVWDDKDDITLCASYILVKGRLQAGSDECRLTRRANIQLVGESNSPYSLAGFGRKFIGIAAGGTLEIHAEDKPTWTKLIETVEPASSTCGVVFNYEETAFSSEVSKGLYAGVFNTDGSLFDFGVFRTGDSIEGEAEKFKDFLETVPNDKIVSVAVQGDIGSVDKAPVYAAIESVGGLTSSVIRDVVGRQAYAFITKTGDNTMTVEKHVVNPTADEFVETGYLTLDENQLQFRVNSKVFSDSGMKKGVDLQVLTQEVAYPCIKVNADVSKWRAGDVVVVASTDYDWRQAEEMTIKSSNLNELCFTEPFHNMHFGEITQGVDERGEVGLLSRNFVIEGVLQSTCTAHDDEDQVLCDRFGEDTFGGQVKAVRGFNNVHIQGVEVRNMGQQKHVGSYPLHFHMCDDVDGNWFRSNSIHHTTRCVTIHGTDGAEFSNNFCYRNLGHSVFLEDSAEQRNLIDGNLVVGTMHGSHLLSDMRKDWCTVELRPFCDALSSFWITHPNNRFINNVAAGSDNVGFWIIASSLPLGPSFERQQNERGLVGPLTAMTTTFLEFRNNTAHSNEERALRIDHRISNGETVGGVEVPENGVISASVSHNPRAVIGDKKSAAVESYLHSFTAYKNKDLNVWTKAGIVIMQNFTLADAAKGITMAAGKSDTYCKITGSLFIGETDNTGMPKGEFGYSVPNNDASEPLQGVIFYQGPGIITNSFFDKYEVKTVDGVTRRAGAISVKRNNPYPPKANSGVEGIKFGFCDGIEGNWAFNGAPDAPFRNKDGNRQINFRDEDGSVSGTANTQFVPNTPFHTTPRCDFRANMNFAVCPYKYAKAQFTGDGALETLDKNYPMHMIRDDRPNDPFTISGERGNNYLVIVGKSYTVYFNGTAPTELRINGFNMEKGDTLRLGLCYPKDVTNFTFTGGFASIGRRNPAIKVNSITELDNDTTGKAYFHDATTGLLFVKMISSEDRLAHEKCPNNRCPALRITRVGGSDDKIDCSAEAYDGTYNQPEDAAENIPVAKPCTTTTSEGYGAEVEAAFFSSSSIALTCPVEPSYPGRSTPSKIGCFIDKGFVRDMNEAFIRLSRSMTPEFCINRCYMRGYTYAAVQNGNECRCGELYGGYGASSGCTKRCTGDSSKFCGGMGANDVYTTGKPEMPALPECGPNNEGVTIDGKCLYLAPGKVSYPKAQSLCKTLGGNLATINSEQMQFNIERYLRPKMATAWIGLHDLMEDSSYEWLDGTETGQYHHFISGQGASTGQDCVALMAHILYHWDDRSVWEGNRPLCQITEEAPTYVSCGHNNYGRSVNGGPCYAVLNDLSVKYNEAQLACATRRGVVADASDGANYKKIQDHLLLYGQNKGYWIAKEESDYIELPASHVFNKKETRENDRNGVVCEIETLSAANPCSEGWTHNGDSCYLNVGRFGKYFFYKTLCNQGDSSVLTIENEAENIFVSEFSKTPDMNPFVYLGYTYDSTTSSFVWHSGSSTYTNWDSNQGDDFSSKGYCAIIKSFNYKWINRPCNKGGAMICKAPAAA